MFILVLAMALLTSITAAGQLGFTDPASFYDSGAEVDDDFGVAIAAASDGAMVATWLRRIQPADPELPYEYVALATQSADGGANWSVPVVVWQGESFDYFAYSEHAMSIATDNVGTWLIAWPVLNNDSLENDVWFSRSSDNGLSWSLPSAVSANAASDVRNDKDQVVSFSGDRWICAWSSGIWSGDVLGTDFDLFLAVSDDGQTWLESAPLNQDAAADNSRNDLSVAISHDTLGKSLAVWEGQETVPDEFGSPVPVKSYTAMAWSADGGFTWSQPSSFAPDPLADNYYSGHVVTNDGLGGWILGWAHFITKPIFSDTDVYYARSADSGASWVAPEFFNHNTEPLDVFDNDQALSLANDGTGIWLGAWDSLDDESVSSIYVRHSLDGGQTWQAPTTLVASNIAESSLERFAISAKEQYDLRQSVYAQRSSGGERSLFPDINYDAKVATDGQGNWVIAWNVAREGDNEVLFVRTFQAPLNGIYQSWVDFDYQGEVETGGYDQPFNTVAEGVAGVVANGVVLIRPGSTPEIGLFSKPARLEAPGGLVRIGKQ